MTEPGGERAQLLQSRQINERLLCGVFGKVKITRDRIGVADRHILKALHDYAKRFPIAGLRSLDQCDQRIH